MTLSGPVAGEETTERGGTRSRTRVAARGGVRLAAAGALLAAVLAGCGSDSDDDTDAATTAAGSGSASVGTTTVPSAGAGSGSAYGGGETTASTDAGEAAEQGTLTIDDFAFSPANPTFAVGQEVVVTNNDTVAHTWTSADGGFDTGLIQPGQSETVTLETAGTFDFVCTPHAGSMNGVVTVTG